MADAPTSEPTEVVDTSNDQAELEARIDAELGIEQPKQETPDANPTTTGAGDAEATNDATNDNGDSGNEGTTTLTPDDAKEGEAVAPEDTEADQEPEPQPDPVEPFITVQDINGKDFKITGVNDLPEDFVPKNNKQVFEILRSLDKLDRDVQTAQEKAAADAEARVAQEQQTAQLNAWDSEMAELQKEGRLGKPKAAEGTPGFAEDPAVKRVDAVFKFMAETNSKRQAAGNPNLIRSFEDALDKYELAESRAAAAEADKAETKLAKDKSGLIGRTSSSSSDVPAYYAGQYSSIDDVPV